MSTYQASPLQRKVQQAVPGLPAYALGSLASTVAPSKGNILTVALASPTATVKVLVKEGQIPAVGQLISIQGAVPSYFNVTNVAIASVTQVNTPDDGTYTLTFALTNANIGTTTSPGRFDAPQIEIGDALNLGGSGTWYSAAIGIQMDTGPNNGRSIRFDVSFPTPGTSTATITAQSADLDLDGEYVDLGTVSTLTAGVTAGQSVIFPDLIARFVRFKVSGVINPASSTVVGKVEV